MRKNRGITLIALIITIIVLLILTAVAVDVAIDGELFDKAQNAVDKTNDKVAQQQNRVDELTEKLEEIDKPKFTLYIGENNGTEWVASECIGTFEFKNGNTWNDFIGEESFKVPNIGSGTGILYDEVLFFKSYRDVEPKLAIGAEVDGEWLRCDEIRNQDMTIISDLNEYIEDGAQYILCGLWNPG